MELLKAKPQFLIWEKCDLISILATDWAEYKGWDQKVCRAGHSNLSTLAFSLLSWREICWLLTFYSRTWSSDMEYFLSFYRESLVRLHRVLFICCHLWWALVNLSARGVGWRQWRAGGDQMMGDCQSVLDWELDKCLTAQSSTHFVPDVFNKKRIVKCFDESVPARGVYEGRGVTQLIFIEILEIRRSPARKWAEREPPISTENLARIWIKSSFLNIQSGNPVTRIP